MGAGRPTKYDPKFCDLVIAKGTEGGSLISMACACGVVKTTIQEWEKAHPEFKVAINRAKQLSQLWWEEKGRTHIVEVAGEPKINAGLYHKSMAARFPEDWRDNSKIEHSGAVTLTQILADIDGGSTGLPDK